jgi:hypothetical protein
MSDIIRARKNFGFPFIIAVRMYSKDGILLKFTAGCKTIPKPNSPTICKMAASLPGSCEQAAGRDLKRTRFLSKITLVRQG